MCCKGTQRTGLPNGFVQKRAQQQHQSTPSTFAPGSSTPPLAISGCVVYNATRVINRVVVLGFEIYYHPGGIL